MGNFTVVTVFRAKERKQKEEILNDNEVINLYQYNSIEKITYIILEMINQKLSILIRCSDDFRIFDLIKSIDFPVEVVISITPNQLIEQELKNKDIKYIITPKGNPAYTTIKGLELCQNDCVLLMDSDCVFYPETIKRYLEYLENGAEIIRPNITFEATNFSSYLTKIAREFQYSFCGLIYEPGLLINRKAVLPHIGNYLFSKHAPFTPDGELDYRIRASNQKFQIITDEHPSIMHKSLSFSKHLYSYKRYGISEANHFFIF